MKTGRRKSICIIGPSYGTHSSDSGMQSFNPIIIDIDFPSKETAFSSLDYSRWHWVVLADIEVYRDGQIFIHKIIKRFRKPRPRTSPATAELRGLLK